MPKTAPEHTTYYTYLDTPIGTLLLAGCRDHGLRYVSFQCGKGAKVPESHWQRSDAPFRDAIRQLKEYFKGKRVSFDLKLNPKGTPFQLKVWRALSDIPYGTTRSYQQIARRVGNPLAMRAVGLANGRNPLPIIVPCHRVIGSSGKLVGYGGGLPVKQALLQLEGVGLSAVSLAAPNRRRIRT
jgi:methylated-DNA-[protein]-cysteine S-methyltransferase